MRSARLLVLSLLFSLFTVLAVLPAEADAQTRRAARRPAPAVKTYAVRANTVIRVRMNDTISSKTARVGDRFTVNVTEPVYGSTGVVVAPVGSTITGSITAVTRARRDGDPGTIDVRFTSLRLPSGRSVPISGSLTSLDDGDTESDAEGAATVRKTRHRTVKFIGGGAAGGALIGAIAGGGKGAIIGGAIGAGAGLAGKLFSKGDDAVVKSGTEFGVIVNRAFSLPRYNQ